MPLEVVRDSKSDTISKVEKNEATEDKVSAIKIDTILTDKKKRTIEDVGKEADREWHMEGHYTLKTDKAGESSLTLEA